MAGLGKRGRRKRKPKEGGKSGQPCKLTPEIEDKILAMLQLLIPIETATAAAGISRQTFYNWRRQGKADREAGLETDFSRFLDNVEKAEALGEAVAVRNIHGAGPQYQLALLRSRFPTRWAESQRLKVEIEKTQGEMLDALKEGLEHDEYVKVIAVLRSYGE